MMGIDTRQLPNIPCLVLAGGASRRFGSNKAFAELQGERLIDRAIRRLGQQTRGPIAINASAGGGFDQSDLVEDRLPGSLGPLAGIHAAMCWAKENGFEAVVTTPVDTPLLPDDFIARLATSGAPSIACSNGQRHSVHGYWPVAYLADLERAISEGKRAAGAWVERCRARHCEFDVSGGLDPFFNVNTPDDLATLTRLLEGREQT